MTRHILLWKKTAVLAAATGFLLTTVPFAVLADTTVTATQPSGSSSSAAISQDQAVSAIQNFYTVPKGYNLSYASYQDTNYDSYWPNGVWQIDYHDAKQQGPGMQDDIHFVIDGKTSKVLSMNIMRPSDTNSLDNAISEAESQKIATDFVKKLAPDQANQVRLIQDDFSVPYENTLSMHSYTFVRLVNGIPYSDNSVTIRLNARGDLIGYDNRWSDNLTFPTAQPAVTADQAQTTYIKSLQVFLQYSLRSTGVQGNSSATLAYVPYSADGLGSVPLLDAMSGQLINREGQKVGDVQPPSYTPLTDQAAPQPTQELTKEQALALVQKYPLSFDGYQLNSSDYQNGNGNQNAQWHFSYGKKGTNETMEISVDTKTGDLASFFRPQYGAPSTDNTNVPPTLTYDQAQKTATNWIKAVLPSQTDKIALDTIAGTDKPQKGQYDVLFILMHDGIPTDRRLNVSINDTTGDVENFFASLPTNITYPSKEQVFSADVAKQDYLKNEKLQFTLQYMPVYDNGMPGMGQPSKVELVYAPGIVNRPLDLLDAHSGEWVSPFSGTSNDLSKITDIKGHWAEKYLSNLYLQGILSPVNDKLLPNQSVTRSEAVRAMVMLSKTYYEMGGEQPFFQDVPPSNPNYALIQQAGLLHWINTSTDKFRPDDKLTRQELAEWIATALGYNDLTQVPGAITNHFHDLRGVDAVHANDIGVASALGLMNGNGVAFRPNDQVTRAEMAVVLSRLADQIQHKGK